MDYEPQTASDLELTERLEVFDKEFDAVVASIDIITVSTEKLLTTLDKRLAALVDSLDTEHGQNTLRDA